MGFAKYDKLKVHTVLTVSLIDFCPVWGEFLTLDFAITRTFDILAEIIMEYQI